MAMNSPRRISRLIPFEDDQFLPGHRKRLVEISDFDHVRGRISVNLLNLMIESM